jgi:hypothetical protein
MLAFDGERNLLTISRIEPRRPEMLECVELGPSLLLDGDAGRGARSPFDVVGLEFVSCGDFDLREMVRRIHDGDSLSIEGGVLDGMTSRDIEGDGNSAVRLSCQQGWPFIGKRGSYALGIGGWEYQIRVSRGCSPFVS